MNERFLKRMQDLLQEEYPAYYRTLSNPPFRGIRINSLKIDVNQFLKETDLKLSCSPFSKEGFILEEPVNSLGNTVQHRQGLFYIQEPSASSAVTVLDPQPHDWVLDLCAAPGGKSTQIAEKLKNEGLLIANEIDFSRSMILLGNMERLGISEAIVTNSSPDVICPCLQGWMDKVLVDAPCSGEGMFKKEDQAMVDWSEEHVQACSIRQRKILDCAYVTLKQDGILVYSTCTYAIEENEMVLDQFLQSHPDMELIDCHVSFGRAGISIGCVDGQKVRKIFPMDQGEGHFVAKMQRKSSNTQVKLPLLKSQPVATCVHQFLQQQLTQSYQPAVFLQKVFMMKQPMIELKGVRVLRQGILCGEIVKNRFEPHHHFYTSAVHQACFKRKIELNEQQVTQYLTGQQIEFETEKGYVCLCYHNVAVGFGKSDGLVIKNKYPKGLRSH